VHERKTVELAAQMLQRASSRALTFIIQWTCIILCNVRISFLSFRHLKWFMSDLDHSPGSLDACCLFHDHIVA